MKTLRPGAGNVQRSQAGDGGQVPATHRSRRAEQERDRFIAARLAADGKRISIQLQTAQHGVQGKMIEEGRIGPGKKACFGSEAVPGAERLTDPMACTEPARARARGAQNFAQRTDLLNDGK